MQVYDEKAYEWNRCVGPNGNMGRINPDQVARECDQRGIPWYTRSWPYASGVSVYCEDNKIWQEILDNSREGKHD